MEKPITFQSAAETVRGILSRPETDTLQRNASVIFLHGWSGNRHGPHRMFVKLARQLADEGYSCLRFDFRGRGESDGRTGLASIASMADDAAAAIDFMASSCPTGDVILVAICSAGKVAITAAGKDPRVKGLVLFSCEAMGYLRGSDAKARKSFHALTSYAAKLLRPETWKKILSGRVNTAMIGKALAVTESAGVDETQQESTALGRFRSFKGSLFFIYGTNDPETTIAAHKYFLFCDKHKLPAEFKRIEGANHSFYSLEWERQVMELTVSRLKARHPGQTPADKPL